MFRRVEIKTSYFILLYTSINLIQIWFTELTSDEAYYWFYSLKLDWGYYDHQYINIEFSNVEIGKIIRSKTTTQKAYN